MTQEGLCMDIDQDEQIFDAGGLFMGQNRC